MTIDGEDIGFVYMEGLPGELKALESVSIALRPGSVHGLVGASGSGKTTLGQTLSGLLSPSSGRVLLDGRPASPAELRAVVALAFQSPENQLFEDTAFEDVAFGPAHIGHTREKIESIVVNVLELLELDTQDMRVRSPFSLSLGEKRRVALAGVLAMERPFVILDEPTAGLDEHLCGIVSRTIRHLKRSGRGVLLISHDTDVVSSLSDEVTVLSGGTSIHSGASSGFFFDREKLRSSGLSMPAPARLHLILERTNPELCTSVEERLRSIKLY
jgi:energy-coupling factor transport system ATP-binding protein